MPDIQLKSSDGDIFEIDVSIVASVSVTIQTMVENLGMEDGGEEVVSLPNINSEILNKVLLWCSFHYDDDDSSSDEEDWNKKRNTNYVYAWDVDFIDVDQRTLYKLALAADYLNIKGLISLVAKAIANMIRGKTTEEIRKTFNLKNDFITKKDKSPGFYVTKRETPDDLRITFKLMEGCTKTTEKRELRKKRRRRRNK